MIDYECKGLTLRHRLMLRRYIRKELSESAAPSPEAHIEVEAVQRIHNRQYGSLWYGGTVVRIRYKGWRFELEARGDVCAELFPTSSPDSSLLYVKDKRNDGCFGGEIRRYLSTDKALLSAWCHKHPRYLLTVHDNNWWECFATDPQGEFHDLMWITESDHIIEGIAEVICLMERIIREIKATEGPVSAAG